jgi:hypothetical protein
MNNREYPWLERITAAVLLLVFVALAWMVLASWQPVLAQWATTEIQVWAVIILLTVALGLVSLVALLHTRS